MKDIAVLRTLPRLRLFGALALTDGEGRDIPISSRRARAVMGYLAAQRGRRDSRLRLAGLFWADRGEAQARASLRQCLTELRIILGEGVLEAGRDWVSLPTDQIRADLDELDAAITAREQGVLLDLLEAIGAHPLLDEPAVSDLHQEWLDHTRAYWERRLSECLHSLLTGIGARDWTATRRLAEALILRHPFDEAAVAAAMQADAALGAGAAAVLRYNVLRTALNRELGVEPSQAVQQALKGVAAARLPPPSSPDEPQPPSAGLSPPLLIVPAFRAADDADLAESVRDEIISGLSRFRDLALAPDSRPQQEVLQESWSRREDAYLLAGAFRQLGHDQRLTVQLVRLVDRRLIWSSQAPIDPCSAESIDGIVARVVGAIYPNIHADLEPRLSAVAPGAFARYLRARRRSIVARTFAEAKGAAEELEALVAEQPGLSFAYLPLARLYNTDFGYTRAGTSDPAARERAFELAKSALALDRGHVHAYTVMGWCHLWRSNWDAAQWHFDQAVDLNPFHADRLMEVGFGNIFLGDLTRARELLERSLLVNPTPKDGVFMDLGLLEFLEGRHALAGAHFDRIAEALAPRPAWSARPSPPATAFTAALIHSLGQDQTLASI